MQQVIDGPYGAISYCERRYPPFEDRPAGDALINQEILRQPNKVMLLYLINYENEDSVKILNELIQIKLMLVLPTRYIYIYRAQPTTFRSWCWAIFVPNHGPSCSRRSYRPRTSSSTSRTRRSKRGSPWRTRFSPSRSPTSYPRYMGYKYDCVCLKSRRWRKKIS